MASFEFLAVIVSLLGLSASITYYASILRNANKTRRTQMLMRARPATTPLDPVTEAILDHPWDLVKEVFR